MSERINELVRQARMTLARQGIDSQKATPDQGLNALQDVEDIPKLPTNKRDRSAFNKAWQEAQQHVTESSPESVGTEDGDTKVPERQTLSDAARVKALQERVDELELRATRLEGQAS